MADATPGAAAAALAGDNAPTPSPAPTPTPSGAPAPSATPSPSWTEGWEQADAGLVEKKGWKNPHELFKSYRELETKLGSDKIPLPKDDKDATAWDAVYNRLGRPESPDKYQFPKEADADTVKALAPELHKLGLSQKQVEGLTKLDLGRAQQFLESQQNGWIEDQSKAMRTLESEWGSRMPEELEHNRRAMRALGISVDEANAFMRGGSEKFLRLLNLAGKSMREDNAAGFKEEGDLGFGMTPNRAAAEIEERKRDKPFWDRYQRGDKAATAAMDRLYRIRSGERA